MGVRVGGRLSLGAAVVVFLSVVVAVPGTASMPARSVRSLTPHAPIFIDSNANFTAANGVTGGSGTALDPYVIEGWDISALTADGVYLSSTSAHVVLRNLFVHDGGPTNVAVLLGYASNVTVEFVNATSSAEGIYMFRSADITVQASNGSTAQGGGIAVSASTRIVIDGNDAWNSQFGVWVNGSTSVTVENNHLHRNGRGVFVTISPGIAILGNVVTDEPWTTSPAIGIDVLLSDGARIVANTISSVTQQGIAVDHSATVEVVSNRVTGNGVGAQLTASSGLIFHNRFYFNTVQSTDDGANLWDGGYPAGGNAWSDYAGVDHCRGPAQDDCSAPDGIGDTPYLVGLTIRDRYPLIPLDLPPSVTIAASRTSALVGTAITFRAMVVDRFGTVTSVAWDFGDASTGQGPVVDHAYAACCAYTVRVVVTDNRSYTATAALNVRIFPAVSFVIVEHSSGFRIPVPSDWPIQKDVSSGGQTVKVLAIGPIVDSFRTNVIVTDVADSSAREDPAYLGYLVNGTIAELQQAGQGAYLQNGPTFLTLSGHLAVAFGIGYTGRNFVQRAVFVVSAAHGREWLIVLSVAASAYDEENATFDSMVSGFQITALPPAIVIALIVGPVAAGTVLAILLYVRYRREHPRPQPMITRTGPPTMSPIRFCSNCGTPVPPATPAATFCPQCGKPLQQ